MFMGANRYRWATADLLERDFGILRQETLKKLPKVRRLEQSGYVSIYIYTNIATAIPYHDVMSYIRLLIMNIAIYDW